MPKMRSSSKKDSGKAPVKNVKTPEKFNSREWHNISALKDQFEPTDEIPISQHKRMAGWA